MDTPLLQHASRGLLIDTNLFLLYIVGIFDRKFISRFKGTNMYSEADFELVQKLARQFHRIVTTPYVIAELSNLSRVREPLRRKYFACLVEVLREAREVHIEKEALFRYDVLPFIGFTDASLLETARRGRYCVLTDDEPSIGPLLEYGCEVATLKSLRGTEWFAN